MTLWLDDALKQSLTFIDNDTRTITDVRLGAQGIEDNTRGTLYFDDFESRRFSYIGTLPDPGVDDPQATNQAGWFARTYKYSASIPHAVTSVNPETGSPDTYSYDANGNMTCRVEGGVTFKQDYNAENRISAIHKMNGTCSTGTVTESWLYGYDGNGVRVSTAHYTGVILDSLTLYYMGGMYEVTGSAVKKYYSMAGQTIMRDSDGSLKYLLTDHLGSTSAVIDANGSLLSQQRYLPFGEVRMDTNPPYVTQTDFGYTFQRNLSGTGLMDYRARMYSPSLGRFIQPDSIIPYPVFSQNWNRFSYVGNNPINFNDPSGHLKCNSANVAEGDCENRDFWTVLEEDYNIFFTGNFPRAYKLAILRGTKDVGLKFSQERGKNETIFGTFEAVYGLESRPLHFLFGNTSSEFMDDGSGYNKDGTPRGCEISRGACTVGKTLLTDGTPVFLIKFVTMSSNPLSVRNNVVHELGHLFGSQIAGYSEFSTEMDQNPGVYNRPNTTQNWGFASVGFPWQQATHNVGAYYEVFADQFLGWIYGTWDTGETKDIGQARSNWMNVNMADWLSGR